MKKIYLSLVLCVIALSMNAQSFSLSNTYVSGNPLFLLEGHATLTNNSASAKDVVVQRTVNNLFASHISYFCWVECYAESVSISPDIMNMGPGFSTSIFKAYVETNSNPGISINTYCFYDVNNIADSVCVEYIFDATTGIADIPAGKNYISKPYPNPAVESTNFYVNVNKGSKNARIKFFNMLGAEVKDIVLTDNKNAVKVNVNDLKSGIYFYSLYINGKSTTTGKLMIAKN